MEILGETDMVSKAMHMDPLVENMLLMLLLLQKRGRRKQRTPVLGTHNAKARSSSGLRLRRAQVQIPHELEYVIFRSISG
jgi:hypothetical protein